MLPILYDFTSEAFQNYETGLKQLTHLQPWNRTIQHNIILVSGQRLPFKVSFEFLRLRNGSAGKIQYNAQIQIKLSDFNPEKYTNPDKAVTKEKMNNILAKKQWYIWPQETTIQS
jgi:hypothetical protein